MRMAELTIRREKATNRTQCIKTVDLKTIDSNPLQTTLAPFSLLVAAKWFCSVKEGSKHHFVQRCVPATYAGSGKTTPQRPKLRHKKLSRKWNGQK